MSYNSSWNLKWIDLQKNPEWGGELSLTSQCVLYLHENSRVLGFTIFEPRDFTAEFVVRLKERMKNTLQGRWHLLLPAFLRHRADSFFGGAFSEQMGLSYSSFVNFKKVDKGFYIRDRMKVVNVDDSPVILKFLKHAFDSLGYVDVLKQISDPTAAAAEIVALSPDFVTMDIQMPSKTGIEVVRELLARKYFPVIMISSLSLEEGSMVFEALNSGAFDYLQKPRMEDKKIFIEELGQRILNTVNGKRPSSGSSNPRSKAKTVNTAFTASDDLLWVLGASTGGTQALTQVFTSLPAHIPPTLIVQHIPPVYSKAFAESLDRLCPFTVKEAVDGDELKRDHVYVAAGGLQMGIVEKLGKVFIVLNDDPPINRFKPSVDYLFKQVAKLKGKRIVAAVLTGMGRDGAEGLLELKNGGARTIAQDEATCAVYGMPRAAVELGGVEKLCSLDTVPETLLHLSVQAPRSKVA